MRKKFLLFGLLAITVLILVLGVLILATQEGRTPPPAITGLIATDASYTRHGQIDLVWSPSDAKDFAYYAIYASETEITDVTGLFPIGRINDRTDVIYQTTRYRIPGASLALFAFMEDTEYWFGVTAVDSAGNESEVGTSVSATIEIMPPAPPIPPISTVFISVIYDIGFEPATVTIPIGTTVSWTNLDELDHGFRPPHTITSDTGPFHGDLTTRDVVLTYTFTEAGVFDYHCELHPWETGTVIVEQALDIPVDGWPYNSVTMRIISFCTVIVALKSLWGIIQ